MSRSFRSRVFSEIFAVVDVAFDILANMGFRHRDHRSQEAVWVGKEVKMRIERIKTFAFARHHNDNAPPRNPTELGDGVAIIKYMFDHVRADHGIEAAVGEWQPLHPSGNEFYAFSDPLLWSDDVGADHFAEARC